ncbi:uncharacterized protein LOC143288720 [Babylonia areolata]|uniref:uncharacterized protein LOC143288720 n=1 Tax=Babylonia areolata TaxID=304850 RepID=UPI003FD21E23
MQAVLIVLVFSGIAAGFFLNPNYSERFHDVTFEYHPNPHVILVRSATECYFIRVDAPMLEQIKDTTSRYALEDQIYKQIQDHTGETTSNIHTLSADLHDMRATFECLRHQVFELTVGGETTTTTTADVTTTITDTAPSSSN